MNDYREYTDDSAIGDDAENLVKESAHDCCRKCGQMLLPDEIAMTKKLINRGTTVYYCIDCLAEAFDVKRADIEEKIAYYKKSGCTLFRCDI